MTHSEQVERFKDLSSRLTGGLDEGDLRQAFELAGIIIETQYNEIKKLQARVTKLEEFRDGIGETNLSG
jgi:hypothetical protein